MQPGCEVGDERLRVAGLADRGVAERSPVPVLVEDGDWLDASTADALAFATRRLSEEAVAVLIACRDLSGLPFEDATFEHYRVRGLTAEPGGELLAAEASKPIPSAVSERLVAATDGNPLALVELARALSAAQLAGVEPLPDPLPADESAWAAAEVAGLLVIADGCLAFRHPLARTAAYAAAAPSRRRAAHLALAAAADPDRRAHHLWAAARARRRADTQAP